MGYISPNGAHLSLCFLISPNDFKLFFPKGLKFKVICDEDGRIDGAFPEHGIYSTIQGQTFEEIVESWHCLEALHFEGNDLIPEDSRVGRAILVVEGHYVLSNEDSGVLLQF